LKAGMNDMERDQVNRPEFQVNLSLSVYCHLFHSLFLSISLSRTLSLFTKMFLTHLVHILCLISTLP
jgi:hypothetical protein